MQLHYACADAFFTQNNIFRLRRLFAKENERGAEDDDGAEEAKDKTYAAISSVFFFQLFSLLLLLLLPTLIGIS